MSKSLFRRGISLILAVSLSASLGLTAFAAEKDGLCEHHPSHTIDCGYEATGECTHVCSSDSGCITVKCTHIHEATCFDAQGNSLCRHACTENPACYTPVTDCLHKEHGSCGHSDGEDCDFAVNGCEDCENPVTELQGTDIVLTDGTEYVYTGQEIKPAVSVMADRTVLVENEHYTVVYSNNIGVGTGTVTVTGIEEAGYKGTVSIPFNISKAPGTPEFQLIEIKGTDVVIEGSEFVYSGQPIEPKVTVTVDGKPLTEGKDYTVTYFNNLAPGTGTLTVKGIGTASETIGYYGKVSMDFTIVKAAAPDQPTEPEKPTEPESPSEPETPTEPSAPEEEDKEETKPFGYKFIKGSGAKWNQDSGKHLTFTLNADTDDITAIRIDGKKLDAKHYTLGKNGQVVLKNSYLEDLAIGTYRITAEFEDGKAEGKFTVLAAADPTNPQTGDTIGLWVGALLLSSLGIGALFLLKKRII